MTKEQAKTLLDLKRLYLDNIKLFAKRRDNVSARAMVNGQKAVVALIDKAIARDDNNVSAVFRACARMNERLVFVCTMPNLLRIRVEREKL